MRCSSPLALAALAWATLATTVSAQPREPLVGRAVRIYVDSSRASWSNAGPRPLRTTLWYPTDDSVSAAPWLLGPPGAPLFRLGYSKPGAPLSTGRGRRPLIMLSHGTGGSAAMLAWLGERLAAAGFVVAAIDHHGNTAAEPAPAAPGFMLWWERATDVSRAVDHLLADRDFGAVIDSTAIGVAGFSLGGYTALMLAGARTSVAAFDAFCRSATRDGSCGPLPEFPDLAAAFEKVRGDSLVTASMQREQLSYLDTRIRAAYAIAPVGRMLTDEGLAAIRLPVRIVVGSRDQSAPATTNGQHFARLIPGAEFELLPDAGHYTFLAECEPAGRAQRPDLCQDTGMVDRGAMHRRVAADAVAFFHRVFRL